MSYKRAEHIFPADLLELIQKYVDGESIYIPRKSSNQNAWGSRTSIREELSLRNRHIYQEYRTGSKLGHLSEKYYLSLKSIQRIIRQEKSKDL